MSAPLCWDRDAGENTLKVWEGRELQGDEGIRMREREKKGKEGYHRGKGTAKGFKGINPIFFPSFSFFTWISNPNLVFITKQMFGCDANKIQSFMWCSLKRQKSEVKMLSCWWALSPGNKHFSYLWAIPFSRLCVIQLIYWVPQLNCTVCYVTVSMFLRHTEKRKYISFSLCESVLKLNQLRWANHIYSTVFPLSVHQIYDPCIKCINTVYVY